MLLSAINTTTIFFTHKILQKLDNHRKVLLCGIYNNNRWRGATVRAEAQISDNYGVPGSNIATLDMGAGPLDETI
jgi:hypothetical protein